MWFDIIKVEPNLNKGGRTWADRYVYGKDTLKDRGIDPSEYWSLPHHRRVELRRPRNYNKIKNITRLLERKNIKINRENILEELMGALTNEDNEAIEYILGAKDTLGSWNE